MKTNTQKATEAIQAQLDKVQSELDNRIKGGDQYRLNMLEGQKLAYKEAIDILNPRFICTAHPTPEIQPAEEHNQEGPELTDTQTALKASIPKFEHANNMKAEGTSLKDLETRVNRACELIEATPLYYGTYFIDLHRYHGILDKATEGLKNPEHNAVRTVISVKIASSYNWHFVSNGLSKPAPKKDPEPAKQYCPDTPTRPASRPKNKVAAIVTEQLIKRMNDSGKLPWRKPWTSEGVPLAVNYVSRKPYKGINRLMLEPGEYISFKQIQERKGQIIKGSHAHYVIFSKPLFKRDHIDESGEVKTDPKTGKPYKPYRFMLRYYRVFSLDDVKGIESKLVPLDPKATKIKPNAKASAIWLNYLNSNKGLKYTEKLSDRAYYVPSADSITVPHRSQYNALAEFHSTTFHEGAHSTGHETRLKRDMSGGMRSHAYSREELIAEITAAFLCRECRLDTEQSFNNSAAYIEGWAKKLKENENLIIIASAQAEKAYNYIMTNFDDNMIIDEPEEKRESFTLTTAKPLLKPKEKGKNVWRVVYEENIKKYLVVNQGGYAYKDKEFESSLEAHKLLNRLLNEGELVHITGITHEPTPTPTEEENEPEKPAGSQLTMLFCPDRPNYKTENIVPGRLFRTAIDFNPEKDSMWFFKALRIGRYVLSIQASAGHYCSPKANHKEAKKYYSFELLIMDKEGHDIMVRKSSTLRNFPDYDQLLRYAQYIPLPTFNHVPTYLLDRFCNYLASVQNVKVIS